MGRLQALLFRYRNATTHAAKCFNDEEFSLRTGLVKALNEAECEVSNFLLGSVPFIKDCVGQNIACTRVFANKGS